MERFECCRNTGCWKICTNEEHGTGAIGRHLCWTSTANGYAGPLLCYSASIHSHIQIIPYLWLAKIFGSFTWELHIRSGIIALVHYDAKILASSYTDILFPFSCKIHIFFFYSLEKHCNKSELEWHNWEKNGFVNSEFERARREAEHGRWCDRELAKQGDEHEHGTAHEQAGREVREEEVVQLLMWYKSCDWVHKAYTVRCQLHALIAFYSLSHIPWRINAHKYIFICSCIPVLLGSFLGYRVFVHHFGCSSTFKCLYIFFLISSYHSVSYAP